MATPDHEAAKRAMVERVVAACGADERVVAVFLGGSSARGETDFYSDLDLGLVVRDEAYNDFFATREQLARALGEPIFLQDWRGEDGVTVFAMYGDGIEVELGMARVSDFVHMHEGPYRTLLDKAGLLEGVVFTWPRPSREEQVETLRGLLMWFWHDVSHHVITPLARGQLWSAYGGLDDLRRTCVNLLRLDGHFERFPDGYEKVERDIPAERLEPLRASCCPLEREAMVRAARIIVSFYQTIAPDLARRHGLDYPEELARVMTARLEALGGGDSRP